MWCTRIWCCAVIALLPALAACEPGAEPASEPEAAEPRTDLSSAPAILMPVDHSGVTGTVVVDQDGDRTAVTVALEGLRPDSSYLAYVHDGRCAEDGPVRVALGQLSGDADGMVMDRIDVPAEDLQAERSRSVHIRASTGETLACANLLPR